MPRTTLLAAQSRRLQSCATQGIPHLFVTNTTSISRAALAAKLQAIGIPAQETEILTPATAVAEWLPTQAVADIALFVRPSLADLPCLADDVEQGASYVVVGDNIWDPGAASQLKHPPRQPGARHRSSATSDQSRLAFRDASLQIPR